MKAIYIDTDILLDIFMERRPFYQPASQLLSLVDLKKIKGFTTPLVFANLFYILRKYKSKNTAIKTLNTLGKILDIAPLGKKSVEMALNSNFNDFENALQYYSAIQTKANYIVTRNKKDFKSSEIPVLSAEEFIILFHQSS